DNGAGQVRTLTEEGMYWVEIWDIAGCHYFDTLHLSFPDIEPFTYDKEYTCHSVIIHGEGPYEYFFYNDSMANDNSLEVLEKGEVFVDVIDNQGCQFYDIISVDPRIMDMSEIELTVRGVTCNEHGQIVLDTSSISGGIPPFSVEFIEAESDRLFTGYDKGLPAGKYAVSILDKLGCEFPLDTIIQIKEPDHGCQHPVITPDSDDGADQYFFKKKGTVKIYNRYGQQVAGPFEGPLYWDGSGMGGEKLPTGSYMAIFDDGKHINITILR
ncbi:MAG: gliding motility-associated C-terminal domain-containing protein, partial [Bacteroidota bacterium]